MYTLSPGLAKSLPLPLYVAHVGTVLLLLLTVTVRACRPAGRPNQGRSEWGCREQPQVSQERERGTDGARLLASARRSNFSALAVWFELASFLFWQIG